MSGRKRRGFVAISAMVFGLVASVLPALPAAADHIVDQTHEGRAANEPCSAAQYPGTKLVTTGESRQSFVPTRGGIGSVEVCIEDLVGIAGNDFTVSIYDGGTAAAPGPLLASVPHDAGVELLAPQWVRITFPLEVPTTPGATYVLGLRPASGVLSSVMFQWRASCADGLLTSCDGVTDSYPDGTTNDLPGNADYAFRTWPLRHADLVGAATVDPVVCPGLDLAGRATGTVTNFGGSAVGSFVTEWVWSADATRDASDRAIAGSRHTVPGLAAGASAAVPPPVLPADLAFGPGHLLLQLDVDDQIGELNELNNVAAAPTTVIDCGQPAISNLTVTVDEPEVPTGFHQVQFTDLDPRALATLPQSRSEAERNPGVSANGFSANGFSANGFSANGFSANGFSANGFSANGFSANGFSANGFSANGFSANGFSAAEGVLVSTVLADIPAAIPESIFVVDIPIAGEGWVERLGGLTDEPIQDVSLAEAVAALPDLTLGEVDLTHVFNMSWLALATAGGNLNDTPLPNGQDWCAFIASKGSSCAQLGVNPATTSLLGLEARGFPTHLAPIADQPLATVDLAADLLVMDLPLAASPAFTLEQTRLGQVPADVALVNPGTVVDCAAYDCSRPLAEASAAGALRNVPTGTLLRGLTAEGRQLATVGDLAMGTASLQSLQLATANWNLANPYGMDDACPSVTYHIRGQNTGDGDAVDPTATVVLPAGFVYVPGTVALGHDGAAGAPQIEPSATLGPDGTRTYEFALDGAIAGPFDLSFEACAGVYLGHRSAGTASVDGIGIDGPYSASSSPEGDDTIEVVERTPGVTTQPLAFEDNVVVADHISASNAHDLWTFPLKPQPRTLYAVRLFTPIDVDLDLVVYGPDVAANGFSANGFSANGFSANGFSANGFSANGFSANGFSANGFSANGFSANGFSTTLSSDINDEVPIEELAPEGSSGHLVSANRGDTAETIYFVSNFGDQGDITIAVADHNGSRSDAPYFLTLQTVEPTRNPILDTCEAAPFDLTQPAGTAPAPWTGTEAPRTLFVTNRQVVSSLYGAAAATDGIAALRSLAARPEVRGIVLEVDHDPNVRAAYAGWRNDWCNPTAANVAASHVRSRILDLRAQYPTIDTIVLAGGDVVVPDWRLPDTSPLGNELHYAEALIKATGANNALVAAYANATLPSADPYGNEDPLEFGPTLAFPPSAGVSRLVETPADWIVQRDQYVATGGNLDPADGLVTGYDGMVDGARAAAQVLQDAGVSTGVLTDEASSWTAADFRRRAFTESPDAAGYNAHTNHWALLSSLGSDTDDESEVVTTEEASSIPFGGLIFSNGCHFGTSVSDVLNRDATSEEARRLADWNQAITATRGGIAVTNSGFGIFDTEEVGQGERMQQLFLEELQTAPNASIALARAKNRFFATAGVQDAYSYKSMQQLSMYGLGIFRMLGADAAPATQQASTQQTAAVSPAGSIPFTAGPYTVETGATTCTSCYVLGQTASGTSVDVRDPGADSTGHTSTTGYWSAPLSTRRFALPPGQQSAGVWINDIDSVSLDDVDPVLTRLSTNSSEDESQTAAPFPTTFATVNDYAGESYLTLLHGIAQPTRLQDGRVRADVHLYNRIVGEVLLRPETTVGEAPHIDEVTVSQSPNATIVGVDVLASELHGPNTRAAAIGRDDAGNWTYRELVKGPNGHWTGGFVLSGGATTIEDLHIQVSNGRGVGHWRNKGDRPLVRQPVVDPDVQLVLSGAKHASGVFTGPVQVTIDGEPGVVYRAFDGDREIGTFTTGQSFTVAGDGVHELQVLGSDGSATGAYVMIDTAGPTITWVSPATNGATVAYGSQLPVIVRCADAGTGADCTIKVDGVPIANGADLPTTVSGTHTITVTAKDGVDRTASATRTYVVATRYVISPFFSPIKPKPTLNAVSPSSNITLKFDVTENGVEQTDPSVIRDRFWQPIDCRTKAVTGARFTTTGTTPEYSGFFHFNTNAPTTPGCYELVVVLTDGTTGSAYFEVKRR